MLLGLRTCQYHVKTSDLKEARDWYARVLDVEPYFDEPFYVGFDVEGFELGLVPSDSSAGQLGSAFTYWGVSDIGNAVDRLVTNGARKDGDIEDVGAGIRKASFIDPSETASALWRIRISGRGNTDVRASQSHGTKLVSIDRRLDVRCRTCHEALQGLSPT